MRSQFFRSRRSTTPHRSGAALVEMALVMPIFCMVVLAIIEFGRAFMVCQLLNDAAREAARSASITGSTNTAVTTDAKNFITGACKCQASDLTVLITITEEAGNAETTDVLASAHKRDLCNVKISVPFSEVSFIPGSYLTSTTLTGRAAMRHE